MKYLLLLLVIVIYEFKRKKTYKYFDLFSAVNYAYALYFCVAPFLLSLIDVYKYYETWAIPDILKMFYFNEANIDLAFWIIVISYLVIVVSHIFFNKIHFKFHNSSNSKQNYILANKNVFRIIIIFGILGFVGLFGYTIIMGGINNTIKMTESVRSSQYSSDGFIIRILQPFILTSFFLGISCCIKQSFHGKNRIINNVLTVFTFMLSLYYLVISGSRSKILLFLVCLIFVRFDKIKIKYLIVSGGLFVVLIVFGDQILSGDFSIDFSSMERIAAKFAEQISYPYINICNLELIGEGIYSFRYFSDSIYVWLLNLIPTFFLGIFGLKKIQNLFVLNTSLMNSKSSIPVDVISYGYWQLGFLGIVINSVFLAYLVDRLSRLFSKSNDHFMNVMYIRTLFALFGALINFEFENIIRGNIDIIIFFIIYITCRKRVYSNEKNRHDRIKAY